MDPALNLNISSQKLAALKKEKGPRKERALSRYMFKLKISLVYLGFGKTRRIQY